MLDTTIRWSLPRGSTVVPSRWQVTPHPAPSGMPTAVSQRDINAAHQLRPDADAGHRDEDENRARASDTEAASHDCG